MLSFLLLHWVYKHFNLVCGLQESNLNNRRRHKEDDEEDDEWEDTVEVGEEEDEGPAVPDFG